MAWSASKVFAKTILDGLGNTVALDLDTDSFKAALYTTASPDNTVTTTALCSYNGAASQWVTANEVSQSVEWPAAGRPLVSATWTQSSNVLTFDAADTSSNASTATLAAVFGVLVHDTSISNQGLCYNYLGGSNSVTAGSFTVVWNASGIAAITV
jgi:hypothetical protein